MIERKQHRAKNTTEHVEQTALFQWAFYNSRKHPELNNLYAIPNGAYVHIKTAKKLQQEGLKAGVPDIFLAVPKGGYHGLYVEMKVAYNKPRIEQIDWINRLTKSGYVCAVCWSYEDAKEVILEYLGAKL